MLHLPGLFFRAFLLLYVHPSHRHKRGDVAVEAVLATAPAKGLQTSELFAPSVDVLAVFYNQEVPLSFRSVLSANSRATRAPLAARCLIPSRLAPWRTQLPTHSR